MFSEILFSITVLIFIYYYLIKNYNYWHERKVKGPKPSIIFGNTMNLTFLKQTPSEKLNEIYKKFQGTPYVGIYEFRTPVLVVRDPNIVKLMLVKDFSHFQGRGFVMNEKEDPLSANLINLSGPKWRILRTKLTPLFTSGKMRQMMSVIEESSKKYQAFAKKYADIEDTIEFRDFAGKFVLDIIGNCFFGIETNSIQEKDSEFAEMCKKLLDPSFLISLKRNVRTFLPGIFKMFGMGLTPSKITKYFMNIVRDIITYREEKKIVKNDMMELLMQLRNKTNDEIEGGMKNQENDPENEYSLENSSDMVIDEEVIAAQAYVFLLAGFDTSSSAISSSMYEIARNPEIQEKLYYEIATTLKKHGSISYEAISEMEFLDRVVRETLRMYPPVGVIQRLCNKSYKIPGSDVIIDKGTKIFIPVYAIHHDSKYYSEPWTFNPERFLNKNEKLRDDCAFLAFGDGPRFCIGTRFAYFMIKTALVTLLSKYKVSTCPKTCSSLKYDPTAFTLITQSGIWLKIQNREN